MIEWVAETGGEVAGMVLGYPLPDPCPAHDLDALPAAIRPLVDRYLDNPN